MNRHFRDARYYLERAGEQITAGLREELAPVENAVRAATGREPDPGPTRAERIRSELQGLERDARQAVGNARERLPR